MSQSQTYPWPDLERFGASLKAFQNPSSGAKSLVIEIDDVPSFGLRAGRIKSLAIDVDRFYRLCSEEYQGKLPLPILDESNMGAAETVLRQYYDVSQTCMRSMGDAFFGAEFEPSAHAVPSPDKPYALTVRSYNLTEDIQERLKAIIPNYDPETDTKQVSLDEIRAVEPEAPAYLNEMALKTGRFSPFEDRNVLYTVTTAPPLLDSWTNEDGSPVLFRSGFSNRGVADQLRKQGFLSTLGHLDTALAGLPCGPNSLVRGYLREEDAVKAVILNGGEVTPVELPHGYLYGVRRDECGWEAVALKDCRHLLNYRMATERYPKDAVDLQARSIAIRLQDFPDSKIDRFASFFPTNSSYSDMEESEPASAAIARERVDVFLSWSEARGGCDAETHTANLTALESANKIIRHFAYPEIGKTLFEKYQMSSTDEMRGLINATELLLSYKDAQESNPRLKDYYTARGGSRIQYRSEGGFYVAGHLEENLGIIPPEKGNDSAALRTYFGTCSDLAKVAHALPTIREYVEQREANLKQHTAPNTSLSALVAEHEGPASAKRRDAGEILLGAHKHRFVGRVTLEMAQNAHISELETLANRNKVWPAPDPAELEKRIKDGADIETIMRIAELRASVPNTFKTGGDNRRLRSKAAHKTKLEEDDAYAQRVALDYVAVVGRLYDCVAHAETLGEFWEGVHQFGREYNFTQYENGRPIKLGDKEKEADLLDARINALGKQFASYYCLPRVNCVVAEDGQKSFECSDTSYFGNTEIYCHRSLTKAAEKVWDKLPDDMKTEEIRKFISTSRNKLFTPEASVRGDSPEAIIYRKIQCVNAGASVESVGLGTKKTRNRSADQEEGKEGPVRYVRPHLDHVVQSTNWLEGKLADEDLFIRAFGVRGVQYGNWLSADSTASEAQQVLNYAFEAFGDMADVLKLPPQTVGLGGQLGLAFGARGIPHALAHYEAGSSKVANLTRMNGAGSLCHEWGHGLSHFVARIGGASDRRCLGHQIKDRVPDRWQPIARDLAKFMEDLRVGPDSYSSSKYFERALQQDKREKRAKPYWAKHEEMFARFFETYVESKLVESGRRSDYLVHSTQGGGVYPTGEELEIFSAKFEQYLDTHRNRIIEFGLPEKTAPVKAVAPVSPGDTPSLDF